ncbi:hypothetical protein CW745_11020 [Psychromonas sp. psych-6C06]|uniref:hypothetical protein n=1 Tax=Psychromonas sp. psych-6C06 TaxID=2058089 RepID=UPI000C34622F|nr:hypothetical protein [Psychromonas sp. psych-6C06]PKF61158.1 hypothetical protein CW745_11020 [Psychromonas sp. psych-6C06]
MSQYVIFKKGDLFVAVECGTSDSKDEYESLTEQGFTLSSQAIEASNTEEALYFYNDNPRMYALESENSAVAESVLATLLSSSWRAVFKI